jgi:hypothetical protein
MVKQFEQSPEKRAPSFGEKAFDTTVYGGLGGVGTFVATIPLADWVMHGGGKKYYEASQAFLSEKALNKVMPLTAAKGVSATALLTFATMQGGNALVAPIWALEKVRTPIINNLNRFVNDPTPPEIIEDKPTQSASSLIKGRLTAFAAVFVGLSGMISIIGKERVSTFENAMGRAAAGFMNQPTHIETMVNGALQKEPTKSFRYGKLIAIDIFATTATASLLYIASRFFAKKKHETLAQDTAENALADGTITLRSEPQQPQPSTAEAQAAEHRVTDSKESSPTARITAAQLDGQLHAPAEMAVAQG